jgi:hypothetical protein
VSARLFPPAPPTLSAAGYENVCNSPGVRRDVKCAYLIEVGTCGSNRRCAELVHEKRCRGYERRGPVPKNLDPFEGLGVLVPENKFTEKTAVAFGRSLSRFSKQVDDWIRFHEKRSRGIRPTEEERLATFAFMSAKVPARKDGSIWLFRNPARGPNAFEGLADEWLGHRLGLKLPRKRENRLALGFLAGRVHDPRQPTYRDVAWAHMSLWQWNGFSRPLPGTPTGFSGLEELVAVSPDLGQIDGLVMRLRLHGRR